VNVKEHESWEVFLEAESPRHLAFLSKFASRPYTEISWTEPLYLVFGSETRGLPKRLHEGYPESFYQVPMRTHLVRSLNLSQCAAIVLYEGLRRGNFEAIGQESGHVSARMEAPQDF
jgi:tRNA (cytidine/uridine-2'-O-)-methyltransferase